MFLVFIKPKQVGSMAKGESGRIVAEPEPSFKKEVLQRIRHGKQNFKGFDYRAC